MYMILLLCLLVFFVLIKHKRNHAIENISRSSSTYYKENVEEILKREKTVKTIKYVVSYTFLIVLALFMILPFYWMLITSLKTESEINLPNPTYFPKVFEWSNWRYIIDINYQLSESGSIRFNIWRLMYNTLVVGVWSTLGTLVTTIMAAFAFSRIKFPGREVIFTLFLATMMIPGEMMVITNYITVVKHLKGMDTYWAMVVPFLISVYYIYLLRQNFRQIPNELYYAAKVDGTSTFMYLIKVMIPIAMPTLITITILKLMGSWNAYVWPMMVTQNENMRLISTGLRTSFSDAEGRSAQGRQMAASAAVTLPLLVMFMFLRRYIMRGVSRSGIKG